MSTALISLLELAMTVFAVVACVCQVAAVAQSGEIRWAAGEALRSAPATLGG